MMRTIYVKSDKETVDEARSAARAGGASEIWSLGARNLTSKGVTTPGIHTLPEPEPPADEKAPLRIELAQVRAELSALPAPGARTALQQAQARLLQLEIRFIRYLLSDES